MLRDPHEEPSGAVEGHSPGGRILVSHPAYEEYSCLLDAHGKDSPSGGIYLPIIHTACAIIANNRFDGYISKSRKPTIERITPTTEILEPGKYYFHVPAHEPSLPDTTQEPYCYPVVPLFRNWKFPNDDTLWTSYLKSWTDAMPERDAQGNARKCVVTRHNNALDDAHIIPDFETQWFDDNGMSQYLTLRAGVLPMRKVDEADNMTVLRADLHRLWDAKRFIIFPKPDHEGKKRLSLHCMDEDAQLALLHHNRALPDLKNVSPACLFARFAWTLFPLGVFLSVNARRLLRVYDDETKSMKDVWLEHDKILDLLKKPQTTSPRKRKQNSQPNTPRTTDEESGPETDSSMSTPDSLMRKRKRRN